MHNPDQGSEITLLRSYAPGVSVDLIQRLSSAFRDLRAQVDLGKISYPFSTRELVNLVRHIARFPGDPIAAVLENVFAFDAFDAQSVKPRSTQIIPGYWTADE